MKSTRKKGVVVASIAAIFAACVVGVVVAAQGPTAFDAPQLVAFEAVPVYDQDGTLKGCHVTAKFRVLMTNPDGKTSEPWVRSVEFDMIRQGQQTVTVGNEIIEMRDVMDDLMAISMHHWKLAHPEPLPQRRRATRIP